MPQGSLTLWRELWGLWGGHIWPVHRLVWRSGPLLSWPGQTTYQRSDSSLPRNQSPHRVPGDRRTGIGAASVYENETEDRMCITAAVVGLRVGSNQRYGADLDEEMSFLQLSILQLVRLVRVIQYTHQLVNLQQIVLTCSKKEIK